MMAMMMRMNTTGCSPHSRGPRRISRLLPLAALLGLAASAQAAPRDFAIYVTRLGGDPEAAQPYITRFLSYLENAVGWPKGSTKGSFFTTRKETLAYIESTKPGLGMIEPGLYLELRKGQDLTPIAQVVSKDLVSPRLQVVVKDPALRSLQDLKGKRLWTHLADSPAYLSRVVLGGQVDAAQHFQLKQIGQAQKGVRGVLRGEADATLVDDDQLAAAKKLEGGGELRAIYGSQPLPPLLLVAFGKTLKPDEKKTLSKVLLELCGTEKGGEVCKEMHITKFAPVNASVLGEAQKRYEQP